METVWWLLAVLGPFAGYALGAAIADACARAAYRRLALFVWTRDPIVNLAPPTMTELRAPDWIQPGTLLKP